MVVYGLLVLGWFRLVCTLIVWCFATVCLRSAWVLLCGLMYFVCLLLLDSLLLNVAYCCFGLI